RFCSPEPGAALAGFHFLELQPAHPRNERVDLVPAGEVDPEAVGDDRRVLAVVEAPDRSPVACVQGPGAARADLHAPQPADATAAAGREVDEPGEDGRRPRDRGRSAEAPANVPRANVERDEVAVPGAYE